MTIEKLVEDTITTAITNYLENKGSPETKHVILDSIFPVERRIRSIIGGLETSLGITVWERLAKDIAKANGFSIEDPKRFQKPEKLPKEISTFISQAKQQRENPAEKSDFDDILRNLRALCKANKSNLNFIKTSSGDGVDLWFRKNGKNYIFDTKTVQINAGGGNNFANKVLHWYAFFWLKYPEQDLLAGMAFPYSPYPPSFDSDSWWAKNGNRANPLEKGKDAFVQGDFWDLLTDSDDTWSKILSGIRKVDSEKLIKRYSDLFYGK